MKALICLLLLAFAFAPSAPASLCTEKGIKALLSGCPLGGEVEEINKCLNNKMIEMMEKCGIWNHGSLKDVLDV